MREPPVLARPRASGLRRVLILGGTRDARELATLLAARPGLAVISSLAGRTRDPLLPPGGIRIGGFGGVEGLARYLRAERIDLVLDATHPFAERMTANAVTACAQAGVPRIALIRPPWTRGPGDRWLDASNVADAAALASVHGRRIFLTTGRNDLAAFAAVADRWFLIRAIDPPEPPLPRAHDVVLARGPFSYADERRLLETHDIDLVVTKNSGGSLTEAKLDAARDRGIGVVMICRPPPPPGTVVTTPAALVEHLG